MTGFEDRLETDLRLANTLAEIHENAFAGQGRAWSGPEILALMNEPIVAVRLAHREGADGALHPVGFALYRAAAGEAELLTVAVAPDAQRAGLGSGLVDACISGAAADGAGRLFLEVGARNAPALALYGKAGFRECGRREGYYQRPDGSREDAVVMECPLTLAADPRSE